MYFVYISVCRGGFSSFVYLVINRILLSENLYVQVNTDFVYYLFNQPVDYIVVIISFLCVHVF